MSFSRLLGFGGEMGFLKLRRKKKPKVQAIPKEGIQEILRGELDEYIKREDVKEYIKTIQRDERRRKVWDGLSPRKKLKLLRYLVAKKGERDGKK